MNKTSLIAAVGFGLMLASQASIAGGRGNYVDTARVLRWNPYMRRSGLTIQDVGAGTNRSTTVEVETPPYL